MSLAAHLDTIGLRRELAELQAETDNWVRRLAHTDAEDVRAQADLGIVIHLRRIRENFLKNEIELQEMGDVQGSRNAELPDRWERRRMLEAAAKFWGDGLDRWNQEYRAVTERLGRRENETPRDPVPVETIEIAARVRRALDDPKGNPTMSFEEAAHAVGKAVSTVRKWCDAGKLEKRSGLVLTKSVKHFLDKSPAN